MISSNKIHKEIIFVCVNTIGYLIKITDNRMLMFNEIDHANKKRIKNSLQ